MEVEFLPSEEITKVHIRLESYTSDMVKDLGNLIKIPAIGPKSGGGGEVAKAEFLLDMISNFGFGDIQRIDVPDEDAPHKIRPNIIARVFTKAESAKNIWIVTHLDIVPEGDLNLWDSDPFEPIVKDRRIYGRGVEDNGQEMIASLYAVKALLDEGITPKYNINLAFVADEETGSDFGIKPLIEKGLFQKDDLIIVPDAGNKEGTLIEVAEKSIMWLKIRTIGKQCHGSRPHTGNNAHYAAMRFGSKVRDELYKKYSEENELFDPPKSTFEPTKKEANVPNVNTIPGEDIFYMDCRILPEYDPEEVFEFIKTISQTISQETGAKFEFERPEYKPAAPPTSPDSPVVLLLKESISQVYKTKPYAGGIGGGTCAAIFRRAGYPAVVWGKIHQVGHAPNEFVEIDNMVNDAKVYATLFCS
jgi:succinyl-diaminopimelate desuccinylase